MSSVRVQARLEQRGVQFDLALDDGEVLAVLGPNGVGKSTLLLMIAGLLRPGHGWIELGGAVVTDTRTGVFVPAHARGVAMLSQQALLFPHMSAAANVAYAPRCKGQTRSAARATAQRVGDEHMATSETALPVSAARRDGDTDLHFTAGEL